jgi:hypothetical protein
MKHYLNIGAIISPRMDQIDFTGPFEVLSAVLLRGDRVAQEIQLGVEYAPEPPFHSGSTASAPPEIWRAVEERISGLAMKRLSTARRVASNLGLQVMTQPAPHE